MAVALIVAAGSGQRLGADRPKALVELAGRPLLDWSIAALRAARGIEQIVVALPDGADAPAGVTAVTGGHVRSDSVRRALQAAQRDEVVLVHDAARPLVTPALAEAVLAALEADPDAQAAIAAAPVTDTVKRADRGHAVTETLDRNELWSVQTPQVFRRGALERALDVAADQLAGATDDASLVERAGGKVIVVPAGPENLKVTTPVDLRLAALLIAERRGQDA
ncbi:MAG: 2-C-methyl-D-erythritol 4-phosphate cytidylyltransferase [Solirubrobacteraceae bacterium]